MKRKIGQALMKIGLYIAVEIAIYNLAIWILDNCITVYR